MVIHHPHRLHEGIANRRSDEAEAPLLQIFAQRIRHVRASGHLCHRPAGIHDWAAADKAPHIGLKAATFVLNRQKRAGIFDGGTDLEPITDDPGIGQERGHPGRVVFRDAARIEPIEHGPVMGTFFKDRRPAEPGLGSFENQEFKQGPIVVDRHSPFLVMIVDRATFERPGAADTIR